MHCLPTVGCFRSMPHAGLWVYTSFFCCVDYDGLLFFSACGFFYLRLLCVLCCDCWFCFALCQRIFDFCLRSFALARATSPFQSQRAGPQRFLVWVRVWWCCALENCNAKYPLPTWLAAHYIAVGDFVTVLGKAAASFFFPYLTKVKLSEKKIIGYLSRTGSTKNVKLSPSIGIMRIGEDEPLKLSLTLSDSAALNASSR